MLLPYLFIKNLVDCYYNQPLKCPCLIIFNFMHINQKKFNYDYEINFN